MSKHAKVDATLSANVYCNRKIDPLLGIAVAPFWKTVKQRYAGEDCMLWFFRYGKCGEHAKLRFYGSASFSDTVCSILPLFLRKFFAEPISDPIPGKWISKSGIPAVDLEDEADEDYPNKTLLWTHYQRSPVLIGSSLYVADDQHVDLYNRSQSAATELVLSCVVAGWDSPGYRNHQQSQFLKMLVSGMSALGFDLPKWIDYLTYHRDWLVRSFTERPTSLATHESMLKEFDGHVASMQGALEGLSLHVLRGSREGMRADGVYGSWARSVEAFYQYVDGYRGKPEYDQDPYTRDFAYLPLFKVFHGAANQFGFRLSHEAYLYHLLALAARAALEGVAHLKNSDQEHRLVSAC